MDAWDWVLLAVGSLVAVSSLVRLMLRRRAQLIAELSVQIENEKRRARQEAKSQADGNSKRNPASK